MRLLSERRHSEKAACCGISTAWHSGKGKTRKTEDIGGCQGLRCGRDEQVEHRGFLGWWQYSVDSTVTVYVMTRLSTLTECTPPRANCDANSGSGVQTMHHRRLAQGNKCTTLAGDMDSERGHAFTEKEDIWKLYFLFNFAVNIKVL